MTATTCIIMLPDAATVQTEAKAADDSATLVFGQNPKKATPDFNAFGISPTELIK